MTWTIPNILSVLRLLAAPFVVLVFFLLPRPSSDWAALLLFAGAALTDWLDGYLARRWHQVSRFGTMIDPIADKAMVVIALFAVAGVMGMPLMVVLPAVVILFREIFVSGLREFLGNDAKRLKVTRLAKWKTTVQMIAISVLFAQGIFENSFGMRTFGMDREMVGAIMSGDQPDLLHLRFLWQATAWSYNIGVALLWLAAGLTFITGLDYFIKARPLLRDEETP